MSDARVPVKDGLFVLDGGLGRPRLVGGFCEACGEYHFPLTAICPYCSSGAVSQRLLSDTGSLWAWTAVTSPPPGYRGEVPFGFGVVELPEGLRVITRLTEADPGRLRFGQAMRLEVAPLHRDDDGRTVVTYAFAPGEGP